MNRKNISVLGGGSWGTVLAYLASLNGNQVNLWMRDNNLAQEINKTSIKQTRTRTKTEKTTKTTHPRVPKTN